jgi:hypothetical protein
MMWPMCSRTMRRPALPKTSPTKRMRMKSGYRLEGAGYRPTGYGDCYRFYVLWKKLW